MWNLTNNSCSVSLKQIKELWTMYNKWTRFKDTPRQYCRWTINRRLNVCRYPVITRKDRGKNLSHAARSTQQMYPAPSDRFKAGMWQRLAQQGRYGSHICVNSRRPINAQWNDTSAMIRFSTVLRLRPMRYIVHEDWVLVQQWLRRKELLQKNPEGRAQPLANVFSPPSKEMM